MNIVFAGSPQFALPCFDQLMSSHHAVKAVYTQPDRPSGRGRKMTATPIKLAAATRKIPVYCPNTLKNEDDIMVLKNHQPDVLVVVAYGLLLPQAVLDIPRLGCINIHPSLLPQWRGAAPIQHTLLAGDTTTGITIMQMDKGMDSGPILMQHTTAVQPNETSEHLHDRLAQLGAQCLLATLGQLEAGSIHPQPQNHQLATYTKKITKQDALIDWHAPANTIANQIRAFNPWPVAHTLLHHDSLRIWEAKAINENNTEAPAGQVIAASKIGIDINTGDGILRLLRVQLPGKQALAIDAFFNAHQHDITPLKTQLGEN